MGGEEQGQDERRTWRNADAGGGQVMGSEAQSEAITQQMQGIQTFTREELEECLSFLQRMSNHISAELAEKPHLDRETRDRLAGELQRNDAWSAEITTRLKSLPRSSGGAITRRL